MPEAPPVVAAAPAALVPARATVRHRWRAFRARRSAALEGVALLGRDVRLRGDVTLGDGCVLGDGVRIVAAGGPVRIGAGSVLGERCSLVAHAGITIGRRCLLGDDVHIEDFAPVIDDVERPTRGQGVRGSPVRIGDGARIGHGAALGPGVTVGDAASIAAHAVVRHDVPAGAVEVPQPPSKRRRR